MRQATVKQITFATGGDMKRRRVSATLFLVWHAHFWQKVLFRGTKICPRKMAHEIQLVWVRVSRSRDKMISISMPQRLHGSCKLFPLQLVQKWTKSASCVPACELPCNMCLMRTYERACPHAATPLHAVESKQMKNILPSSKNWIKILAKNKPSILKCFDYYLIKKKHHTSKTENKANSRRAKQELVYIFKTFKNWQLHPVPTSFHLLPYLCLRDYTWPHSQVLQLKVLRRFHLTG